MEMARNQPRSTLTAEYPKDGQCRILTLHDGGAKGFYTLGVLNEIERMVNFPLNPVRLKSLSACVIEEW
jgi:uncharacterized protein